MFFRILLSLPLALAAGSTAAGTDGDPNRPVIVGKVWNAAAAGPSRTATQSDLSRLRRLNTKPSVKCARIQYIYQCLTSQPMHLKEVACRPGSTEASCCKGVRDHVTANICGPVWDRLKEAGKPYFPGIWLCKCVEQPRTLRRGLKVRPSGVMRRQSPDPNISPAPVHSPEPVEPN